MVDEIKSTLQNLSSLEKKEYLPKFFKAGKGEYAEGDQFIGVTVPNQRIVAKEFGTRICLSQLEELLSSPIHEIRSMLTIGIWSILPVIKFWDAIVLKMKMIQFWKTCRYKIISGVNELLSSPQCFT